ncbi:MAG TPA: GMC family oxidoreductase N-terminal domain-containing protein [Baekduia sp.]|uniref:GMC family oxidoreductase n=1 Tax=Baekduia sp. TaxID=2600305 RepID=UPI002D79C350|nr:GMC family oxidoreductase N-terminal domain-containing protein [Baekduia sp.]HET6509960.1 GMC family oxidoreductase N-terminal domain-containing protein [Baekduia sp.]
MYDYVIVGAGSAGCVLANRLTEDPDVRVLVVEAGPMDESPQIQMPLASGTVFHTRYDWDFPTETEDRLDDRSLTVPRGKVIGGTSSINGMCYTRGPREDYDNWASAYGATGWGYDDVLPYFRRAEGNERGADAFHGGDGPLTVSDGRSNHPFSPVFLEACEQAGLPANDDFNGATWEGVGRYQLMQRDGRRCSNAKAYLHPVLDRPNLDLVTDSQVLKILFEGDRAVGVETFRYNNVQTYRAAREVLVCAGAIMSPVLLMLSGIGPAAELAPFGIEVRQDLPVGRGLQDHPTCIITFHTERESLISAFTPENVARFETEGRGPLTSNVGEVGGFIRSTPDAEAPDFQIFGIAAMWRGPNAVTEHGLSMAGYPTKMRSRGRLALRTADPFSKPRMVVNYLSDERERRVMREGIRRLMELSEQRAYAGLITKPAFVPASKSDEDVDAFVRKMVQVSHHHCGTCAINEVVDPELRVLGVEGLRVIDASVMPEVNQGNTNAPVTMIGEKGADLVRGIASARPEAAVVA